MVSQENRQYSPLQRGNNCNSELPNSVVMGAWRALRPGEEVNPAHIDIIKGVPSVPARLYGNGERSLLLNTNVTSEIKGGNEQVLMDSSKGTCGNDTVGFGQVLSEKPRPWSNPANQTPKSTGAQIPRRGTGRYSGKNV